MTPSELNLRLTELQLQQRRLNGGQATPQMWTRLEALDQSGRRFVCHVTFEVHTKISFTLDAAIDLSDPSWPERLDAAIFDERLRWRQ